MHNNNFLKLDMIFVLNLEYIILLYLSNNYYIFMIIIIPNFSLYNLINLGPGLYIHDIEDHNIKGLLILLQCILFICLVHSKSDFNHLILYNEFEHIVFL